MKLQPSTKLVETKVENPVNSRNESISQIPNSPPYPPISVLNLAKFCCQKPKTLSTIFMLLSHGASINFFFWAPFLFFFLRMFNLSTWFLSPLTLESLFCHLLICFQVFGFLLLFFRCCECWLPCIKWILCYQKHLPSALKKCVSVWVNIKLKMYIFEISNCFCLKGNDNLLTSTYKSFCLSIQKQWQEGKKETRKQRLLQSF